MSEEELVTIELTGLSAAELDMVNAVIHEGELRERERIIALLESIKTYPTGWDYDDPFASVVALIKGETL